MLRLARGEPLTVDQLCRALKLDPEIWANKAAVIWAGSRLVEFEKATVSYPPPHAVAYAAVIPKPAVTASKLSQYYDATRPA